MKDLLRLLDICIWVALWIGVPIRAQTTQATLSGHTDLIWDLAFSPDDKTLASLAIQPCNKTNRQFK